MILIGTLCVYNVLASHRYYKYKGKLRGVVEVVNARRVVGFSKVDTTPLFEDDDEEEDHSVSKKKGRLVDVREFVDDPDESNSEDELYTVRAYKDKDPIT